MRNYITNSVSIKKITFSKETLHISYDVDGQVFHTSIHFAGLDINKLYKKYGKDVIENILFHIAFFEGMKFTSLVPKVYDVSLFSSCVNPALVKFFSKLYEKIMLQHRWENNLPNYHGPKVIWDNKHIPKNVKKILPGDTSILFSSGGGKDSFLGIKILEESKENYSVSQYSHSVYGLNEKEHILMDKIVNTVHPSKHHRISIQEDFYHSEFLKEFLQRDIRSVYNPETPAAIFANLLVMLSEGYTFLAFGNESDAEEGNMFWEEVKQEVNHQWIKTFQAEQVVNGYIRKNLLKNFTFFSILRPIYDFLIFQLLNTYLDEIYLTESCNVKKPWCKRCPKCVYIWLCYMAYAPNTNLFDEDLFNELSVQTTFRELMGLGKHKPFECVGEIGEVQLALYICYKRGMQGEAIDIFTSHVLPYIHPEKLLEKYNRINEQDNNIPSSLLRFLLPKYKKARVSLKLLEEDYNSMSYDDLEQSTPHYLTEIDEL